MRYHYTSTRMAKIWNSNNTKRWRGCGATEILITAGGGGCMQNGAATWEDSLVVSYETKHTGNSNLASGYLLKGTETCFYT